MRRRAGSRWSARTGATWMRCGRRRCCCPSSAPPAPRFAPPKACPTPRRRSDLARAWIGRQHSLSDTAIRKRAKANGWTRDLSGAVRSRFAKVGSRGRLCEPARRGNALRPPSSMRRRAGSRSGACPTSRRSGSIDPDVPGPSLWTSAWIFVSAPTSPSSGTAIVPVAGASLHMNFQE